MTTFSVKMLRVAIGLLLCVLGCFTAYADNLKVYDVTLSSPGTLRAEVGTDAPDGVLRIAGPLNNDDVRWLRSVCGGDTGFAPHPSVVKVLDLTKAEFSPDSSLKPFAGHPQMTIQKPNSLPAGFLYGCTLDSLILPERLNEVEMWALASTGMKRIEIPEGIALHNMAVCWSEALEYLSVPQFVWLQGDACPNLKRIVVGDAPYVQSRSFYSFPRLEEVVFKGVVGHIDGYQFKDCPELKRVVFCGPIGSMGGPGMFENCPKLEDVEFLGLLAGFGLDAPSGSPDFHGYKLLRGVMMPDSPEDVNIADKNNPEVMREAAELFDTYRSWLTADDGRHFMVKNILVHYDELIHTAESFGVDTMPLAQAARPYLENDFFKGTPKLEVLRKSAPYRAQSEPLPQFKYSPASDSLLVLARERFNLGSIAGEGSDFERMKRLNYWVHDLIRHDGASAMPGAPYNVRDIYDLCRREDRGVNCRVLAIILTEALLAEGIPARYLTCQPEAYKWDNDCHVIVAAWSSDYGKWIWLDPTHASYVTDENGLPLHPGEVRERLIAGLPLVLNEDANWNHQEKSEVEEYLKNYMAKNLYCITARVENCSQPEGAGARGDGRYVALVPEGFDLGEQLFIYTSDPDRFWAPPQIEKN